MSAQTCGINAKTLHSLTLELQGCDQIVAAFLHGSAARGGLRPDSDVDVALLLKPGQKLPTQVLLSLAVNAEKILGRKLHLGLLSLDNLIFATEVYQNGRELFCREPELRDRFFMDLLSRYVEFNRARQVVLDAYLIKEGENEYSAE